MNAKDFDAFMRKCMNDAPTPDDGRYINPTAPKFVWLRPHFARIFYQGQSRGFARDADPFHEK